MHIVKRMEQQDGEQAEQHEVPEESVEKNPEENAVKFYANMFFYYSVYDGASDKAKVRCQFEHMLEKISEEIRNCRIQQR